MYYPTPHQTQGRTVNLKVLSPIFLADFFLDKGRGPGQARRTEKPKGVMVPYSLPLLLSSSPLGLSPPSCARQSRVLCRLRGSPGWGRSPLTRLVAARLPPFP